MTTSAGQQLATSPIVVAILSPGPYPQLLAVAARALERLDPRIEVVVEPYVEGQELRTLRSQGANVAAPTPTLSARQRSVLGRAHVVLALDLPAPIGAYAPNLRWVQAVGAGIGQLRAAGLAAANVRLTTGAGTSSVGVAEFAMARILQVFKDLRAIEDAQRERRWEPIFGRSLEGRAIALVGLGAINREVARLAQAFSMRVLASHRTASRNQRAAYVDEIFPSADLGAMIARAEIVVAAVPEDATTQGILSAEVLAAMRPGSVLCNFGRGSAIDERALIHLLRSGHLGAAILDVATTEPLPSTDPLWDAPRLYYSSHCAVVAEQLYANLFELLKANMGRWLRNEALINEVPG